MVNQQWAIFQTERLARVGWRGLELGNLLVDSHKGFAGLVAVRSDLRSVVRLVGTQVARRVKDAGSGDILAALDPVS